MFGVHVHGAAFALAAACLATKEFRKDLALGRPHQVGPAMDTVGRDDSVLRTHCASHANCACFLEVNKVIWRIHVYITEIAKIKSLSKLDNQYSSYEGLLQLQILNITIGYKHTVYEPWKFLNFFKLEFSENLIGYLIPGL